MPHTGFFGSHRLFFQNLKLPMSPEINPRKEKKNTKHGRRKLPVFIFFSAPLLPWMSKVLEKKKVLESRKTPVLEVLDMHGLMCHSQYKCSLFFLFFFC